MILKNQGSITISVDETDKGGIRFQLKPGAEITLYNEDVEKSTQILELLDAGTFTNEGDDEPSTGTLAEEPSGGGGGGGVTGAGTQGRVPLWDTATNLVDSFIEQVGALFQVVTPVGLVSLTGGAGITLATSNVTLNLSGIGASLPSATLIGGRLRLATALPPADAASPGLTGQVAWDADFFYVCVAEDTWKRVALATW